jgi:hypothetical protein
MLRNLGRFVWSQTRDMNVYNYPRAMLYEIRTADGGVWLKYYKKTENWSMDKRRPGDVAELFPEPIPSVFEQPLPSGMLRDTKSCCR